MFRKGQKLVVVDDTNQHPFAMQRYSKGDIVTYSGEQIIIEGFLFIVTYEYELIGIYCDVLRPLLGDSAKDSLIQSFTEVTETSDLPIRQPETA